MLLVVNRGGGDDAVNVVEKCLLLDSFGLSTLGVFHSDQLQSKRSSQVSHVLSPASGLINLDGLRKLNTSKRKTAGVIGRRSSVPSRCLRGLKGVSAVSSFPLALMGCASGVPLILY